jgi:hypothetical protein
MNEVIANKIAWNIIFALYNAGFLKIARKNCNLLVPAIAKIIIEQKDHINFDENIEIHAKLNK